MKNWVPKIYREKGFRTHCITPREDEDLNHQAVSWWKDDQYTKVKRYICISWLGRNLIRIPYRESIKGTYFKPADDLVTVVRDMQSSGIITKLNASSKVFEGGCNIGRNLYYLQNAFQCMVEGIDISEKAVGIAKSKIWKGRYNYKFHVGNVLDNNFFDRYPDDHFDMVFTRWHLIHIPRSESKSRYVESLKRIGKTLVLFEPVKEGHKGVYLYHNKSYALSWDDWAKEYIMEEFNGDFVLPNDTRVFYFKK